MYRPHFLDFSAIPHNERLNETAQKSFGKLRGGSENRPKFPALTILYPCEMGSTSETKVPGAAQRSQMALKRGASQSLSTLRSRALFQL